VRLSPIPIEAQTDAECPMSESDGQRIGTVEPVFANLRHNKRMNRLNLRGQVKVRTQWSLYCMVHNIEKLQRTGFGQIGVQ